MKLFYSCQKGRSMIEMLGVLAIVGVLSIGGIAGFSKAMRTYKVNKLIEEYSIFINALLEFSPSLKSASKGSSNENRLYLASTIEGMGILPQNWTRKLNYIHDSTGRRILIYLRGPMLTILPYVYDGMSTRTKATLEDTLLCQRTLADITIQLAPIIHTAYMWQNNGTDSFYLGKGDKFCGGNNCLRDLNISTITHACSVCVGEGASCTIAMDIPL